MNNIQQNIIYLNEKIIEFDNSPVGLFNGKMGYCIYFYELSRLLNNKRYEKIAENYLEKILKLLNFRMPVDVEYGLMGIAIGMHYLSRKKFIDGNTNKFLEDFDILLFKFFSFQNNRYNPACATTK